MKLQTVFTTLLVAASVSVFGQSYLFKKLDKYCSSISKEQDRIPSERKDKLNSLADKLNATRTSVMFASADNSTESQLAQAWLQVAKEHYGLRNLQISSGGEAPSAINKAAMHALKEAGFKVEANNMFTHNPRYTVSYSWQENGLLMFSKQYGNFQNPTSEFIAVATSNNLAPINGEATRVDLSYSHIANVGEQSEQIAREMFYLAQQLQSKNLLSHQQ